MSINRRKVIFWASVLFIVLYLCSSFCGGYVERLFSNNEKKYMDVPIIEKEELEEKIENKTRKKLEEGIFFNYCKAPMDIENQTIYIAQNIQIADWEGIFSLNTKYSKDGYEMYWIDDGFFADKQEAIREGHEFELYLVGDDYYKFEVVFSGVGVMSVSGQYELPKIEVDYYEDPDTFAFENQPEYIGEMVLLSSNEKNAYQTVSGYVKYHLKGATSLGFPKKSYAITLVDSGGKDVSLPLMGMESGPKWKLNALYTDNTLVREKSACDIWRIIDTYNEEVEDGSFASEYVELIMDGSYVGVYLLVEPIDADKLELDNNDVLYKCVDWGIAEQEKIDESIEQKWRVQYPFRIRYPKVITDYHAAWNPIKDFSWIFWEKNINDSDLIMQKINVSNLLDAEIFLEICALSDNKYKNIYYVAHVESDEEYVMLLHPWDFDLSFGHVYKYGAEASYEFGGNIEKSYGTSVFEFIIDNQPELLEELHDTYKEYRETILSDESIECIIRYNWDVLKNSGSYVRNLQMWEVSHGDTDVEDVLDYLKKRIEYIDTKYQYKK